jgi:hypothetical protein
MRTRSRASALRWCARAVGPLLLPRRVAQRSTASPRWHRSFVVSSGRAHSARGAGTTPSRMTHSAAWVRDASPSLVRMLLTWVRAVRSLIDGSRRSAGWTARARPRSKPPVPVLGVPRRCRAGRQTFGQAGLVRASDSEPRRTSRSYPRTPRARRGSGPARLMSLLRREHRVGDHDDSATRSQGRQGHPFDRARGDGAVPAVEQTPNTRNDHETCRPARRPSQENIAEWSTNSEECMHRTRR